jgi:hypothetical protein
VLRRGNSLAGRLPCSPILTRGDLEGRLTPLTAILADSSEPEPETKGLAAVARALAQAERCPCILLIFWRLKLIQ